MMNREKKRPRRELAKKREKERKRAKKRMIKKIRIMILELGGKR
jgi:hypothetical protein